ncbi:MAG: hypothetical protein PHV17_05145 [Candidatus Omnitrophica bacterium]|nr:hypothetical protein [Candidatus Omnitrophota bacterium]
MGPTIVWIVLGSIGVAFVLFSFLITGVQSKKKVEYKLREKSAELEDLNEKFTFAKSDFMKEKQKLEWTINERDEELIKMKDQVTQTNEKMKQVEHEFHVLRTELDATKKNELALKIKLEKYET